jgi:hypothetical protein
MLGTLMMMMPSGEGEEGGRKWWRRGIKDAKVANN